MKPDDELLQDMKQHQHQTKQGLLSQSEREIALFLKRAEEGNVGPNTRYFSITRMKFIPLWTIYYWPGYDNDAAYVSAMGTLYELRGIGYIAPASQRGKLHIGKELASIRKRYENELADSAPVKKKWYDLKRSAA